MDPKDLKRLQKDLATMRAIQTEEDAAKKAMPHPGIPHEAQRIEYPLRFGLALSAKRRIADHWKRTPFAGTVIVDWRGAGPKGQSFDTAFGPDTFPDTGGPYKVRIIGGKGHLGAVKKVSALEYQMLKDHCRLHSGNPTAEPVPDDEPECDPIVPSNFPSTVKQAQTIYEEATNDKNPSIGYTTGAAIDKNPNIEKLLKYFWEALPKANAVIVVGTNGKQEKK